MHDFLQSPVFLGRRPAAPAEASRAPEPLRGIMRSFETDLAAFRRSPKAPARDQQRAGSKNRR